MINKENVVPKNRRKLEYISNKRDVPKYLIRTWLEDAAWFDTANVYERIAPYLIQRLNSIWTGGIQDLLCESFMLLIWFNFHLFLFFSFKKSEICRWNFRIRKTRWHDTRLLASYPYEKVSEPEMPHLITTLSHVENIERRKLANWGDLIWHPCIIFLYHYIFFLVLMQPVHRNTACSKRFTVGWILCFATKLVESGRYRLSGI